MYALSMSIFCELRTTLVAIVNILKWVMKENFDAEMWMHMLNVISEEFC